MILINIYVFFRIAHIGRDRIRPLIWHDFDWLNKNVLVYYLPLVFLLFPFGIQISFVLLLYDGRKDNVNVVVAAVAFTLIDCMPSFV